jgi:hypothetical protein
VPVLLEYGIANVVDEVEMIATPGATTSGF